MTSALESSLSRRERQIMDFLFRNGQATAAEVQTHIPSPPSYSTVRALLRTLESKGYVRHHQDGPRYVYAPMQARETARRSALRHLVRTFFDGSSAQAAAALLDIADGRMNAADLERLAARVEQARREGR